MSNTKTQDGFISIRIDPKDRRELVKAAKDSERTIAGEVRVAIREHLARLRKEAAAVRD